jgi:type IX secretion system PorP/SprF family membrane protein
MLQQFAHIISKGIRDLLILISCLFFLQHTSAQDTHFTQFFANPLILSPAATGNFQGNIRGGANYKYQWPWASNLEVFNYHTQAAYVDIAFLEEKVKRGWMGIGANFLNDVAGDGRLRYTRLGGSIAWHQTFERENRYVLSVGFQGNYISKTADFDRFYYNNQWVEDVGFDLSRPNFENPDQTKINAFDMGFGFGFDARPVDNVRLSASFSMLHINTVSDQFYNISGNKLGQRYVATVGGDFDLTERVVIKADWYFTYQKKAWETVFGGMAGFKVGNDYRPENLSTLWIGSYLRMVDSWAPIIGYSYRQCRVLVNYDVIISKLARSGKLDGGLEISLVLATGWKYRRNEQKIACPRF